MNGKVYLVGAGPGDPELLTVKALRLLRTADVVLHDDLVSPEILKLISPSAEVQNVGKRCGSKTIRQEEINFLMVARAASGLQVVRLKSGDPLIFGRAGEEIEALRRSNIEYEIVPGVTSALGAAAAAGIPLTHRRASSTIVLTAGHRALPRIGERCGLEPIRCGRVDPCRLHAGLRLMARFPSRLTAAGFAEKTPCAIISRATTPEQRIHRTTVSDLHRAPRLASPTLLVVGEVVEVRRSQFSTKKQQALRSRQFEAAFQRNLPPQTCRSDEEPLREHERKEVYVKEEVCENCRSPQEAWRPERVLGMGVRYFRRCGGDLFRFRRRRHGSDRYCFPGAPELSPLHPGHRISVSRNLQPHGPGGAEIWRHH